MPLKRPGSPALWGTTKAGGRAMPTRRPVPHGRRRGGRGGRRHVRVLTSVLAGTWRGRRAPGTVTLPLRAPPQGVVGALPARHAQERGRRKGGQDGQRGLKKPREWGTEAGAAASAVDGAHTHGTRRTRAREPPQRPQRGRLRQRATVGGRPAPVHAARKRVGWGPRAAPHSMPPLRAWVGGRRRGPRPSSPARGQKASSVGPARGDSVTGPPTRRPARHATACRPPRTVHAGRRLSEDPRVGTARA